MNCTECRDNLVASVEGLLEAEASRQCQAHLETCAACRDEQRSIARLRERLVARGALAGDVSLADAVMRRVRQARIRPERTSALSKWFQSRWGFGLGAAAAAAAVLVFALAPSGAQARAAAVLAKGARAVAHLATIHLRGQLRTLPGDNYGLIEPDGEFYPIDLWKQFGPELKWRVEKPDRVVVMDGQSTIMYIKRANLAVRIPGSPEAAFDTGWLHRIADLSHTLSRELKTAQAKGWKLDLTSETSPDGRPKTVVTIHARSGLPADDYGRNKAFDDADTRRVYCFDAESERLEAVQVYLERPAGEVQIFELSHIDYDQPLEAALWQLDLPANVDWYQEPQKLPDNDKYAAMTAEEAARAFFEACGRRDWNEVAKFDSPVLQTTKDYLGGLELVSLGKAFTSKAYSGSYVPYEIKLQPREVNVRLSNGNPAQRYVLAGTYDRDLKLDEEWKWSPAPEILPDNAAYARLSPREAAQAAFAALQKLDWAEMRKFLPASEVDRYKRAAVEAEKRGLEPRLVAPVVEVGEAFWSEPHSAWFVKCRWSWVKQYNLALRRDNPAGRWEVDGGL